MTVSYETCPTSAPFFGFMGVTAALCFASKCFLYALKYYFLKCNRIYKFSFVTNIYMIKYIPFI